MFNRVYLIHLQAKPQPRRSVIKYVYNNAYDYYDD